MPRILDTSFISKNRVRTAALVMAAAAAALGCAGDKSAKEPEATPAVRFVGRVDASDPAAVRFSWSAVRA